MQSPRRRGEGMGLAVTTGEVPAWTTGAAAPAEPLLVWCGNGHACKEATQEWVPMG